MSPRPRAPSRTRGVHRGERNQRARPFCVNVFPANLAVARPHARHRDADSWRRPAPASAVVALFGHTHATRQIVSIFFIGITSRTPTVQPSPGERSLWKWMHWSDMLLGPLTHCFRLTQFSGKLVSSHCITSLYVSLRYRPRGRPSSRRIARLFSAQQLRSAVGLPPRRRHFRGRIARAQMVAHTVRPPEAAASKMRWRFAALFSLDTARLRRPQDQ